MREAFHNKLVIHGDSVTDDLDVAVIGAGAAGISAARRLAERGHSVLLIDALTRLGGRAYSLNFQGMPLDLGCGWLHSAERNPLVALAESMGLEIDRSSGAWTRQLHNLHFTAEAQQAAWDAYRHFTARLHRAAPPSDRTADALVGDDRWRPFIDAISSYVNGTETDQLSATDFLVYDTAASDNNWRLPSGYGNFIAALGARLPATLSTRVTSVVEGNDIVIGTERGSRHARAAIITVSTSVLINGSIQFPRSAEDHLHAAACLPLGVADKVYLSIATPDAVPAESHLLGRLDRTATGSYYLRPFGRPIIECYLGGSLARELEDAGETATVSFVLEELRHLLGTEFARGLAPIAITRWAREATIGGSYSHALPGLAHARAVLARPVSERVCFAGEACSPRDFSTAHGAWESGILAADWIEVSL